MGRQIIQSFPAASTTAIANNVNMSSLGNDFYMMPNSSFLYLGKQGTAQPIGFTTTSNYTSNDIYVLGLLLLGNSLDNSSNLIDLTVTGLNNNTIYTNGMYTTVSSICASTTGMTVQLVQNSAFNSFNAPAFYSFQGMQRNISITSNGNNFSTIIFTVFGTNLNGDLFFESLAGPDASETVYTTNQFAKICNIYAYSSIATQPLGVSIGTGTLATFSWVKLDVLRNMPAHSFGVQISGTVFCKIQTTLDVLETTVSGQGQVLNPNPMTIDFATNVSATQMWPNVSTSAGGATSNDIASLSAASAMRCIITNGPGSPGTASTGSLKFIVLQQGLK